MKTKKIKESELENDKRTLEKRKKVKEKLKGICNSGQDIDDILTSLDEIRGFLKEYEHDNVDWCVPSQWMSALDGASDVMATADPLHSAVALAVKDHDLCTHGLEDE